MIRTVNTTLQGYSFSDEAINAIWLKAQIDPVFDARYIRRDCCGALIARFDHGQISQFGWEIDHIYPVALGGADVLQNLQPLHWKNNRHKSDNYPNWSCALGG